MRSSQPQSDQSQRSFSAPSKWHTYITAIVPFVLTVLVSVALSLLVQSVQLFPHESMVPTEDTPHAFSFHPTPTFGCLFTPTEYPESSAALSSTSSPIEGSRIPLAAPTPTLQPNQKDIQDMRNDVTRLQSDMRSLWSAYYLVRAANQIADAEVALRTNDLDETKRLFVMVGVSLDLAYERSEEQLKGPVKEFRSRISEMYEDVYIRPENMDQRLRRLRQSMLSIVDVDHH